MMAPMTAAPPPPDPRATDAGPSGAPSAALVADAERLRLASTRLARILRQETHTGLTPTQVAALATLQRHGPVPVGFLADAEQITAPTATKVVDKLARAGLVERRPHPDDRRVSLVTVTEAGHDLLAATRRHKTAWLATRLAGLDPDDRRRLLDAVDVLEAVVAPDDLPAPDHRTRVGRDGSAEAGAASRTDAAARSDQRPGSTR